MSPSPRRIAARPARWVKQHQHVAGLRQALDLSQRAYDLLRRLAADPLRPAHAGGWPLRLVPLPAPRPYTRRERRELRRVLRAQQSSFFDGGAVRRFEELCARRFGARHAIAVSSGTAALHCALIAGEIGPGDEVIVPVLTYVSTAFAVLYRGATPRFVDVDPKTFNVGAREIEAAITERTRAILPVHLCGVPCDMEPILALARARGLLVVEDAAQAHGAYYAGKHVGTLGHLGCFSFGSTKNVVTGEGGLVLTDDEALARRARLAMSLAERTSLGRPALEEEGWTPESEVEYELLGWNYRMSALQAALGIAQLEQLDAIRARLARNAERLAAGLADLSRLARQAAPPRAEPCLSTFLVTLREDRSGPDRDALAAGLARERIDRRLPLRPLAQHPIFAAPGRFPVAELVHRTGLGLRVDRALGDGELDATALAVRRVLTWAGR